MPLDPLHPTPAISINRVRLVNLPGLSVDPEVRNRLGGELVSARALSDLIRAQADVLRIPPDLDDRALHAALEDCLGSEDDDVRVAAEGIARRIGRNLGYLLLTLRRGDAVNRAARPEWDNSYWRHWASIREVWLGGGLVSGRLGPHMRQHALAVFEEAGIGDTSLHCSAYGDAVPLVGLARLAPLNTHTALVFDCGGSRIKSALAIYRRKRLLELQRLPTQPATWPGMPPISDASQERWAETLLAHLLSIFEAAWQRVHGAEHLAPYSPMMISIAAYTRGGHPLEAQRGLYMHLRHATANLQRELARRLHTQLGEPLAVTLIGDGRAAAHAYAGASHAAVIMLGTAMGIGFPPPADHTRPAMPSSPSATTSIDPKARPCTCPRHARPSCASFPSRSKPSACSSAPRVPATAA